VAEYPLLLILACVAFRDPRREGGDAFSWGPVALLGVLAIPVVGLLWVHSRTHSAIWDYGAHGWTVVCLVACIPFIRRPALLAMSASLMFLIGQQASSAHVTKAERTFFGVYRIITDAPPKWRFFFHGTTLHNIQSLEPGRAMIPVGYYHREGPIGGVFAAIDARHPPHDVGVLGLGAGGLICFGHPGQEWTFYEIDPEIERLARDRRYFTFLSGASARWRVRLGDARLCLKEDDLARYDLLIMDVFGSDAIPVHLMTREAFTLYQARLKKDGMLVIHISNNY